MKRVVIKYGGNAMLDARLQRQVVQQMTELIKEGIEIVLVHGGGPFIAEQLDMAGIRSEFVEGHRVTTTEAMPHIEMALKGKVNGQLVSLFNQQHQLAIGLSGKDVQMVIAKPRRHSIVKNGKVIRTISLGQVGDVTKVHTTFIDLLLQREIIPVIACIATGLDGRDYNVNGDVMAGHIAGALRADHFLILTDIDGLRHHVDDPKTHISSISSSEIRQMLGKSIQGGMIPKVEACLQALDLGAKEATIINGTKPELMKNKIIKNQDVGTNITK